MKPRDRSYTVFLGGEFSSLTQLIGNAWLAEEVFERSHGRFRCILPQDIRDAPRQPRKAREQLLRELLGCDLALLTYAGRELTGMTAVALMAAKFADLPVVLLRTDAPDRDETGSRDRALLGAGLPRTIAIHIGSLGAYRSRLPRAVLDDTVRLAGQHGSATAQRVHEQAATQCVRALDRLVRREPQMPKHLRQEIYEWLPRALAFSGKGKALRKEFERHLENKVEKELL